MPGSPTTPDLRGARSNASRRVAFRLRKNVGVRDKIFSGLDGWPVRSPADASPPALTSDGARLGADVDCYSFIVSDLHRLLPAGLPAHCEKFWTLPPFPDLSYSLPYLSPSNCLNESRTSPFRYALGRLRSSNRRSI